MVLFIIKPFVHAQCKENGRTFYNTSLGKAYSLHINGGASYHDWIRNSDRGTVHVNLTSDPGLDVHCTVGETRAQLLELTQEPSYWNYLEHQAPTSFST